MAKTLEQALQEQLGVMAFQLAVLGQQLEVAQERIKQLEAEKKATDGA